MLTAGVSPPRHGPRAFVPTAGTGPYTGGGSGGGSGGSGGVAVGTVGASSDAGVRKKKEKQINVESEEAAIDKLRKF